MNLSAEDAAEYARRCAVNQAAKEAAIQSGDIRAAKRARQAQSALYDEFKAKQIIAPRTHRDEEYEMTLEQRVARIEQHLQIGAFAKDF